MAKEQGSFYPQSQDGEINPIMVAGVGLVVATLGASFGNEVAIQLASRQVSRGKFLQIALTVSGALLGGGSGAGATAFIEVEKDPNS